MILHDARGKILSVARVEPPAKDSPFQFGIGIKAGPRQTVTELEVSGELARKSLEEIHERWAVDTKAKKLVDRGKGRK